MCQAMKELRIRERAEGIITLLGELGEVPEDLRRFVLEQCSMEVWHIWLKKAAKVESIEEFRRYLQEYYL